MSRKLHLTSAQADAIQLYIWQIRDLMGLAHWDIFLGIDRAPDDARAQVRPTEGKHQAAICLCRHWLKRSPSDQRDDIVHELVHCLHRDQTEVIRVGLDAAGYVPARAMQMLWAQFSNHTEIMVDHLAGLIAPIVPLPDWAGGADNPGEVDIMGGKPSKGTPADRRIKGNKSKPAKS